MPLKNPRPPQALRHAPHLASGLAPLKAKRLKIAIEFLRQLRTAQPSLG
jgi:hypothetical protein